MNRDATGGSPWNVLAWIGILFAATLSAAPAADPNVGLGVGMHAYYGGRFEESYESLSQVIQAGTKDPRVYYLRGLAARRIGRGFEAESDFNEGARLEAIGNGGWNVGRALERVQGGDRLVLERYRAKARASLAVQGRDVDTRSAGGFSEADDTIFRRRRPEVEGDGPSKPKAAPQEAAEEEAAEEESDEETANEKDEDAEENASDEEADEEADESEEKEEAESEEEADSDQEDDADAEDADAEEDPKAEAEDEPADDEKPTEDEKPAEAEADDFK